MKFATAFTTLLTTVVAVSANPFAPKATNKAESNYVNTLVSGARPTANSQLRALDQNGQDEEVEVDISGYAVKFEQCQFVRTFDEELAEDEDSETVLATKRFVIFRLCPSNSCSNCNYGYGEYMIELEEYLEATVEYQTELQEEMCQACDECQNDEDEADDGNNNGRKLQNVDCDSCYDECQKIENMEANGYLDATEFLECVAIYDPEDDDAGGLWAGPVCSSQGTKIKIGVFDDENCYNQDSSKDVEDYLMDGDGYPMKLSHALLKTTYSEDSCVSCLVVEEEDENADDNNNNNNGDEEEKEAETVDMCQQLYEMSAKCETVGGFSGGIDDYDAYANQADTEDRVCDYITSIRGGAYDESGDISIKGTSYSVGGGSATTGGQKFALTFFTFGTLALAIYAASLHTKLTKGGSAGLSNQGGALA